MTKRKPSIVIVYGENHEDFTIRNLIQKSCIFNSLEDPTNITDVAVEGSRDLDWRSFRDGKNLFRDSLRTDSSADRFLLMPNALFPFGSTEDITYGAHSNGRNVYFMDISRDERRMLRNRRKLVQEATFGKKITKDELGALESITSQCFERDLAMAVFLERIAKYPGTKGNVLAWVGDAHVEGMVSILGKLGVPVAGCSWRQLRKHDFFKNLGKLQVVFHAPPRTYAGVTEKNRRPSDSDRTKVLEGFIREAFYRAKENSEFIAVLSPDERAMKMREVERYTHQRILGLHQKLSFQSKRALEEGTKRSDEEFVDISPESHLSFPKRILTTMNGKRILDSRSRRLDPKPNKRVRF